MAEYTKDKEFSWGWTIGGAVLMAVMHWFASFVVLGAGIQSFWLLVGIILGAYALAGFVIGWQSEGQTIIEAGIAAVLAIGFNLVLAGIPPADVILIIAAALPFGAAIFGAWIGELVQGNVIVRSDD